MYERILVGTDGSKTAAKAVERAVEVAPTPAPRSRSSRAARPERGAAAVVAAERRHAGRGGRASTPRWSTPTPVAALIDEARDGRYDLLVMGNKGMTGLTRFFRLGSVPNKVSHHLPCSLLIVKTT